MADEKLVKMLKEEGPEKFNQWRKENPKSKIDLKNANLCGANLEDANLRSANLIGANLIRANLIGANLIRANLEDANLRDANLRDGNLIGANLIGANLEDANLFGANLEDANLEDANLEDANLRDANLRDANLRSANLSKSTLFNVNFIRTILDQTNFKEAMVWDTQFSDVDLSQAKGLDQLIPKGPSSVDHRTLIKSKNLPEKTLKAFLESCGMPEQFIDYLPSLVQSLEPIQYFECFISYGGEDKKFVGRLHKDLRAKKVQCWFAPEDAIPGKNIKKTLDTQIRLRDKLILILSKNSIHKDWVVYEAKEALREEKRRGKPILIPIMLDDAIFTYHGPDSGWANKVRERFIGDFRNCEEDDALYKEALERLLKSLLATEIESKEI